MDVDAKKLLGNVAGYMKRKIRDGFDSGLPGMTEEDSKEYFRGRHDNGFYGHIKSGSHKASKKVKGVCK